MEELRVEYNIPDLSKLDQRIEKVEDEITTYKIHSFLDFEILLSEIYKRDRMINMGDYAYRGVQNKAYGLETSLSYTGLIEYESEMIHALRNSMPGEFLDCKDTYTMVAKMQHYEDFYVEEKETVLVSTIHKSKGREFDVVYMLLNNVACFNDEEKRKIYVGLTRAKNELYIHCNNSIFNKINLKEVDVVKDERSYGEPDEIMLQLSYRDVVLDYFKEKKDYIVKLRSGDVLQVEDEYLSAVVDGKIIRVIKYSKAFKERLDGLKAKGYRPSFATIRFVLAWKGKEDENETAIILPDLCFEK